MTLTGLFLWLKQKIQTVFRLWEVSLHLHVSWDVDACTEVWESISWIRGWRGLARFDGVNSDTTLACPGMIAFLCNNMMRNN